MSRREEGSGEEWREKRERRREKRDMTVCVQVDFHAVVEVQKVHCLYSQAGDGPEDRRAHGLNLNWKKEKMT